VPVVVALLTAAVVSAAMLAVVRRPRASAPGDVVGHPDDVGAELATHPRARRWLERGDAATETTTLLTVAIAAIAGAIVAVGVLLEMARRGTWLARWDDAAARWGARRSRGTTGDVLRAVTELGATRTVVVAAAAAAVLAWVRTRRLAAAAFLATTLLTTLVVNNTVKAIVDRPRPDIARLVGHAGSSFPSGHTATAAAAWAAIALVAGRGRSRRVQAALVATAAGITAAVASTRVLLGVHWVTDVLAGAAVGWSCFAVCSIAFGGRRLHFGDPVEVARRAAQRPAQDALARGR